MNRKIVFTSLLLTVIAFYYTEAAPSHQYNDGSVLFRVKRQSTLPTSDNDQFNRCIKYKSHGPYSHSRLLLIWYNSDKSANPLKYLRNILANDLDLAELVFTLRRVKYQQNNLLFEMSSNLNAFEVLRNYCKLFNKITKYRSQGYDDPALTYEILLADQDFND